MLRSRRLRAGRAAIYGNSRQLQVTPSSPLEWSKFGERMNANYWCTEPSRSIPQRTYRSCDFFLDATANNSGFTRIAPALIYAVRPRIRGAATTDAFNATRRRSATSAAGKSAHSEATRRSAATPPTSQRARKIKRRARTPPQPGCPSSSTMGPQ